MYQERAALNCQRCYEFAEEMKERQNYDHCEKRESDDMRELAISNFQSGIRNHDMLWTARNQALQAVEMIPLESTFTMTRLDKPLESAQEATTACYNCDFKKPYIANLLGPKKEENKEKE